MLRCVMFMFMLYNMLCLCYVITCYFMLSYITCYVTLYNMLCYVI